MKKTNICILIFILCLTSCTSTNKKLNSEKGKEIEYRLLKGINYTRQGEYFKGLKEYNIVYEMDKKNILVLKELGKVYTNLNEYNKGKYYYLKALKLDNEDQETLKNLAYICFLQKNYKESFNYINRLSTKKIDLEMLKLKSYILYKEENYEEAYKIFNDILKDDDNFDLEYYKSFSEVLDKTDKKDELRLFLENNKEKYKNNKEYVIFYSYGIANYFKQYKLAENELKRYIVSYGGNDELYIALAYMKYSQKNYKEADMALKFVSDKAKYSENYLKIKERLKGRI